MTPFLAMTQADLESLIKSRLVIGWIVAALFLGIIRVLSSQGVSSSVAIARWLSDFVFLWSLIVIGITGTAVSSESGELADSLLSKSVKRYEYILAKFCSRMVLVFTVYACVSVVLSGLTMRVGVNDIETYGLLFSIFAVGLALVMLTMMGVMFSTVFPSTIMSIVALLVTWYSMTFFFPLFSELEFLSPSYLVGELPRIIQGNWGGTEWQTVSGFGLMSTAFVMISMLYFSNKDL
jgi:hypothetical protein